MFRAMLCWETLSLGISVVVRLTQPTAVAVVFPDDSGLFQKDNTSCYTAHIVQEWFEEHDDEFKVLPWPPNSPHLNPIKHLWDVLEHSPAPPRNLQDLLLIYWCQIP